MAQHISTEQCKIFLKFMQTHPNLAKRYYIGAKVQQNKLWKDLALNLNANGPPIRNVNSWKECWCDWRNSIKTRIAQNRCGSGKFQEHFLSPIEYQLANVCDIFWEVDYRIPNAKALGLPDSESRLESLRTASPTRSRLSTTEVTSNRKSRFQEKIQKQEKDETKEINVSLEVVSDTFPNNSHASCSHTMSTLSSTSEVSSETKRERSHSRETHRNGEVHDTNNLKSSSYTMSTLSPTSDVSSETKRKRSQSKEIHNEQVHDTNKLKYVVNEIKEINATLENHTKQLKNINTTLEEMCSLKKQELEETKRHHLALERIATEKIKQKLNRNFTKNNTIA